MYYTFKSRVRYSECDQTGHLSLTGVINYLQDCSTFQSEGLGKGVEALKENKKAWVMSSWKLEIEHLPMLGEEIEIGTFAIGFRGFFGFRNFFIKDSEGNYLVKVYSIWTLISLETGHPVKVAAEDIEAYGIEPELPMKDKSRKVPAPDADARAEKQTPVTVCRYHLDTNHHMNNGRYAEIASAYLPDDFPVHSVHISYKKAAFLGNVLYPVVYFMEKRIQVSLQDENGEEYCVCEYCKDAE